MSKFLLEDETYKIIGICMEIHSLLGPGLNEIVYKDAMEYEFKMHSVPYEREKKFEVHYKDIILPHYYNADFTAYNKIILEVKACSEIVDDHIKQALNYISIAQYKLSLILNFGAQSFQKKRVIR